MVARTTLLRPLARTTPAQSRTAMPYKSLRRPPLCATSSSRTYYQTLPLASRLYATPRTGRYAGPAMTSIPGASARRGVSFMSFLRGIVGGNVPSTKPAQTTSEQQETSGQTAPKHSSAEVPNDGHGAAERATDTMPMKQHDPSIKETPDARRQPKKTIAELDEELRNKMSGLAGDGGEAGVEYEDGQPVAMKRSVKNNMFRYI